MDIKAMYKSGVSIKQISRQTGHSRNTIRKIVRAQKFPPKATRQRVSKLDPYKPYIEKRFAECGLNCERLLDEIRDQGYDGSVSTIRRYVQGLKADIRQRSKLTVRFETAPGEQAQVDWAHCGRVDVAGRSMPIYAFVMVLGFSRMLFVCFTHSMKLTQLLRCHLEAFAYFGGWPRRLLYDNMKQVKLQPGKWNPAFVDFIDHYGIEARTCRPYRPRTKGKVERAIDYVKGNFLNGRTFTSLEDMNARALAWLNGKANARVHATTGKVPEALLAKEGLRCDVPPYVVRDILTRKVNVNAMVQISRSLYSVPPRLSGKTVEVVCGERTITVRMDDTVVAEHPVVPPGESHVLDEHVKALWRCSLESAPTPPRASWAINDNPSVAVRSLAEYEQVAP